MAHTIKAVDIFSVGKWNGTTITERDLDDIVDAFESTKEHAKPALKLGHNENQTLLADDGLPAAGWVSRVYRQGTKLKADFTDIPQKIYKLLEKKAYRKVSIELFSGVTFNGKKYPKLLSAVALLGADTPAVKNLDDILSLYTSFSKFGESDTISPEKYTFTKDELDETEGDNMPPEDNNKDQNQDNQAEEIRKLNEQIQTFKDLAKKSADDLASYKQQTEKQIGSITDQANDAAVKVFTTRLESTGLLTPSMTPLVEALARHGRKADLKFTFKAATAADKDETLNVEETIEKVLKLAKECYSVNLNERTKNTESKDNDMETDIAKVMADKKISYSAAYREVMRSKRA